MQSNDSPWAAKRLNNSVNSFGEGAGGGTLDRDPARSRRSAVTQVEGKPLRYRLVLNQDLLGGRLGCGHRRGAGGGLGRVLAATAQDRDRHRH